MRYVRLVLVDGSRFILRVISDTAMVISGYEVDAGGDEIAPPGHDRRLRIVGRDRIKRSVEMRMNNHYATLEVA